MEIVFIAPMSVMVQLIALMAAMKMTDLVFVSDCGKMGISEVPSL